MICKKCGANIADTSKFCGYCGEQIEEVKPIVSNSFNENAGVSSVMSSQTSSTVEPNLQQNLNDLKQPTQVSSIAPDIQMQSQILNRSNFESIQNNKVDSSNLVGSSVTPNSLETPVSQNSTPINNESQNLNTTGTVESIQNTTLETQKPNENPPVFEKQEKPKKSASKTLIIVLGIILIALGVVLAFMAFNKGESTNTSTIDVLSKALSNLDATSSESGTMNMNMTINSNTNDSISLSAILKYAKQSNNNYDMSLKINKSLISDEMNLYMSLNDTNATLYLESTLLDLLGLTYSEENIWLKQTLEVDASNITEGKNIDIMNIIDEAHFKYVDNSNNLNHYQLIIDESIINKINQQYNLEQSEITSDIDLQESYVVDLYLTNDNQISMVSMELSNIEDSSDISSITISITLSDLDSTVVTIPEDALNSNMIIDDYMANYAYQNENTEEIPTEEIDNNF